MLINTHMPQLQLQRQYPLELELYLRHACSSHGGDVVSGDVVAIKNQNLVFVFGVVISIYLYWFSWWLALKIGRFTTKVFSTCLFFLPNPHLHFIYLNPAASMGWDGGMSSGG